MKFKTVTLYFPEVGDTLYGLAENGDIFELTVEEKHIKSQLQYDYKRPASFYRDKIFDLAQGNVVRNNGCIEMAEVEHHYEEEINPADHRISISAVTLHKKADFLFFNKDNPLLLKCSQQLKDMTSKPS